MIEGPESLERGFGVSYTIFTIETLRSNSGTYPGFEFILVAEWIHFTLWGENITHCKTESVHCLGPMNPATKSFLGA